jgi:hypothetical protein
LAPDHPVSSSLDVQTTREDACTWILGLPGFLVEQIEGKDDGATSRHAMATSAGSKLSSAAQPGRHQTDTGVYGGPELHDGDAGGVNSMAAHRGDGVRVAAVARNFRALQLAGWSGIEFGSTKSTKT